MAKQTGSGRRGLVVLGLLGCAVVLAGGAALAGAFSGTTSRASMSDGERLAQAQTAYARGQLVRAEDLLRLVAQDKTRDLEIRLFYGQVLLDLGRLSQARDLFNTIRKEHPDTAEAIAGLGQVHERLDETDLALMCFKRACELKKDDARYFRMLGLLQHKMGDDMAALFSIRQSLRILPGQQDLSRLLDDLGTSRQARAEPQGPRGRSRPPEPPNPYDVLSPRSADVRGFPPSDVPDPLQGLPVPGRER